MSRVSADLRRSRTIKVEYLEVHVSPYKLGHVPILACDVFNNNCDYFLIAEKFYFGEQ